MKFLKTYATKLLVVPLIFLAGCANINNIRNDANSESVKKEIASTKENRVLKIIDNETYYSPKLMCLGRKIGESEGYGKVKISVAPIFDKTGKVYQNNATAISELVTHSLSKIGVFSLVETPLGYDFSEVRNSFSIEYLKANAAAMLNNNRLPIGVLLPSDIYVAGSLVQYDDTSEVPGGSSFSATLNVLQARKSITSVSVGLQLRLVQSSTGKVLFLPKVGSASVFLKSQLFKSSASANIFKTVSSDPYGFDYSVDVADPVQYAVNEIVEKAIYELISKFTLGSAIDC